LRLHPHLYEINTWPWLEALSRRTGRSLTLGGVPDAEWDRIRALGMDAVYLMGIWRRSALGREIARSDPRLLETYRAVLPDLQASDIVGSAFCISAYEPDPRIGTWDDLDAARETLHARGLQLVVDFIPNHTGFDHPWTRAHPDRYVSAPAAIARRDPASFRAVDLPSGGPRFIACARDPYFPPWTDVAQLNYFDAGARAAMIEELRKIAGHADGVRVDMAMLALTDVFGGTWGSLVQAPPPSAEFWADARAAVPGFLLIAEVYWDLEWRLQQLGFDFAYDKRLYDRLHDAHPREVRAHLSAGIDFQNKLARFVENHDEARSVVAFGHRAQAAAAATFTLPGLRFFFDGQFEGRRARVPVQLGRMPDEAIDTGQQNFYRQLLSSIDDEIFHTGTWELLDAGADAVLSWQWRNASEIRTTVVSLSQERWEIRKGTA
jgi:glycosidase